MRRMNCSCSALVVLATTLGLSASAWAVPYASGVYNKTATLREFVLNESADLITVLRDGANPLTFNNPLPGRFEFDMTGFSSYSIEVSKNAAVGYAELSQSNNDNLFTKYYRPNGIAVNKDPASPFFGTVYVSNGVALPTENPVRQQGGGIYSLSADLVGVDLVTKAAIANADDASLAKFPSEWFKGGVNSPYQISLDAAGNVIAADWSDDSGGIKYATADLTGGGLVLDIQDGVRPLLQNSAGQEFHGSIASKVYTTGSIGNGLTVYAMDEDMDLDFDTSTEVGATGNHVWKWNVGNATNYDQQPELVINVSPLSGPVTDPTAVGTEPPRKNFLNLNVGVDAKATFSEQHNKWYLSQNRNDGNEAGLIVVTADGIDGNTPTMEWSSIQWSIDNLLDGFTDDNTTPLPATFGKQDVFRGMGSTVLSDDGRTLFVHRRQVLGANPFTGATSPLSGAILVIPLDENGIPDIQINDNGTPEDTSDDILSNLQSITIANNNNNKGAHDIALDAAGNIYIGSNSSERLQVFSPGGNFKAVTRSDGTFELIPLDVPGFIAGDFDGSGAVGNSDLTLLLDNWGAAVPPVPAGWIGAQPEEGIIGNDQLTALLDTWGQGEGAGSLSGAVPEPTSGALLILGLFSGLCSLRRGRKAGA